MTVGGWSGRACGWRWTCFCGGDQERSPECRLFAWLNFEDAQPWYWRQGNRNDLSFFSCFSPWKGLGLWILFVVTNRIMNMMWKIIDRGDLKVFLKRLDSQCVDSLLIKKVYSSFRKHRLQKGIVLKIKMLILTNFLSLFFFLSVAGFLLDVRDILETRLWNGGPSAHRDFSHTTQVVYFFLFNIKKIKE